MIPSLEDCLGAWERYQMLENIRAHSLMVAKIAHLLALELQRLGAGLSVAKTTAGALMHDIGKTRAIGSGEDHSELGRQICLVNHFEEIADIVAEHVRLRRVESIGVYSEKEIVYYADKRVNHDRIVSLDQRLEYILSRYGGGDPQRHDAIRANFDRCRQIEGKIFERLAFGPETIGQRIAADPDTPMFECFFS